MSWVVAFARSMDMAVQPQTALAACGIRINPRTVRMLKHLNMVSSTVDSQDQQPMNKS
jgi:hypothetical protein